MPPLAAKEIRGNWATLLLPIQRDETIDFELLAAELDSFADWKVNGVYSNGSAGEFYTQTEAEFDRISQLLAEKCTRRNLPFQIGVSHMSPQISRDRLRRIRALRPSGVQIILPDWFPPTLDDIHRFLDGMAEAAGPLPLIVYNPPHAKRNLTPADWRVIVQRHRAVAGIKVPGGDAAWYREMKPVLEKISVFIPGHLLATGLKQGARGAYSNVACLSPGGAQRWYELCRTDPAAGLKLEERIRRFILTEVAPMITVNKLSNMAADKAMAVAGRWLPGFSPRLRWPYQGATRAEADRIGRLARQRLPELFAAA